MCCKGRVLCLARDVMDGLYGSVSYGYRLWMPLAGKESFVSGDTWAAVSRSFARHIDITGIKNVLLTSSCHERDRTLTIGSAI